MMHDDQCMCPAGAFPEVGYLGLGNGTFPTTDGMHGMIQTET